MDLSFLSPVISHAGPVGVVHVDASRNSENAEHLVQLRWAEAEADLQQAGAPEDVVALLRERATAADGVAGNHGRTVVADGSAVLLDVSTPVPPVRGTGSYGAVPQLFPLVRGLDAVVPHVLVEVDHVGADIHVVDPRGREVADMEVEGSHDVLHRYGGGGWSHRRFQMRALDSFERNAEAVLETLEDVVTKQSPAAVLLTGDPTSRGIIRDKAGTGLSALLVELEHGGRAEGTDHDALAQEVDEVLGQHRQRQMGETLARFEQDRGRGRAGVDGLGEVVRALRAGAVDTLLLVDDPSASHTLWTSEEPMHVGNDRSEVESLGAQEPVEAPADAVLVRALVAQDGAIELVEGASGIAGGVGAILRFPLAPDVPGSTTT